MRIKLDDKHYLNSDQWCYWITCDVIIEKGRNAGYTTERRVSGYYPTLSGVIEGYIDRHINSSEATTLKELSNDINKLKKDLKKWNSCLKDI